METSLLNKSESSADVDLSKIKVISFISMAVVLALVAGYFIAVVSPVYALIFLVLFWTIFALQIFFIKDWTRVLIAIFLESAAMLAPSVIIYRDNFSGYVFLALGVVIALLISAENHGRQEIANSLKIPFWGTSKNVITRIIPAILIFVSVIYVFIIGGTALENKGQIFSENILTPVVAVFFPDFSSKMSLRDLIPIIVEKQIGKETFKALPSAQRSEALRQVEQMLKQYTGGLSAGSPLGTAVYDLLMDKLQNSPIIIKASIVFSLIWFLWFMIKIMTWILYIPVFVLTLAAYEILLALNFIVIQYESRSKEIILLK